MAQEIAVAAGTEVVKEATSDIYGLLKQQISYVFKYQNYINDLKKQVLELRNKRQMVQNPVESAERQGEEIYELVTTWLSEVHEFTEGAAKSIIEDEDKANKGGCFKLASCPNFIQRYRLGKKAMKATMDGADLLGKGNFSHVSYRPALQRTESMYVRGYEAFDSRMQVLQEIMDTLKDVNVNMIGVYGMGGVGKTTLVKKIAWQAKENKLFDEVVIAEVTQNPDYKKIQEKIASELGLEFKLEGEYQRVGLLRNKIKKEKNVLLILDDIWTKLDFDAIGIPFGDAERERNDDKTRRCTILLTSRKQDVLSKDMNTQKNIHVPPLSDEDAWNLFVKIVGDLAEKSDFQPIATEIVKKCAGLPVAISAIANALRNESLYTWEDALSQLKKSNPRCTPGMDDTLYSTIELSYKFLKNEEAQSLFLLCALDAEGVNIFIDDLLKYTFGWGLFQNVDTLEEGRNRLHSLINHLKGSCLLLDGDSNDRVKMHDIIHAVAVTIASSKFMFNIQNATGLEKKISKKSTAISLPYKKVSYELPKRLECPELVFFCLSTRNRSLQVPDIFFERMKEIKVLDLTGIHFLSLPPSLCCLKNIRTLCLDGCMLGDVAIIGELNTLEILSFLNSDIEQLPSEIGQLTHLKLLDLSNCLKLKVIAPNVISSLLQLEELYIGNSFVQWEADGANSQGRRRNASLRELKRLSNLRALHLHIPDVQVMPRDMFFEKLNSYKILIGDKWNWSYKYDISTSRTLKLKINANNYLGHGVRTLLKMTEDLSLEEINGVRNVLYELHQDGFPHLKHLLVQDGLELLYIVNSFTGKLAFPELESLVLSHLINLEKICHGQFNAESFGKLRILKIEKCDRLEYLFASSVAKNLTQLQEIEVTDCKNLKEIFGEESKDYGDEIETDDMIEFNQLSSLTLQSLPRFIKIGSDMRVVFPNREEILGLNKLKSLKIDNCNSLRYVFTPFILLGLVQLQELEVKNCALIEEIIKKEGQKDAMSDKIIIPQLNSVTLESLPNLTSFYSGNDTLECPPLETIIIKECPKIHMKEFSIHLASLFTVKVVLPNLEASSCFQNLTILVIDGFDHLKYLFPSSMVKSLFRLKKLKISNCKFMERVVDEDEERSSPMLFPKLYKLKLRDLPKLVTFYNSTAKFVEMSSLFELWIENCPSVQTFISNSVWGGMTSSSKENEEISATKNHTRMQYLFDEKVRFPSLEILVITHADELVKIWDDQVPLDSFCKLNRVLVYFCKRLVSVFPSNMLGRHQKLEQLEVQNCHSVEEIFEVLEKRSREVEEIVDKEEAVPKFVFSNLAWLSLQMLPSLKSLYPKMHISEWPNLIELSVHGCDNVEIFASEFSGIRGTYGESQQPLFLVYKGAFPCLEELELREMPRLLHLWRGNSQPSNAFQNLKTLKVSGCGSLENSWSSTMSFQNLETLQVSKCDGLRYLLTPLKAKSLDRLTRMNVSDCKMMGEIITHLGDEILQDPIVFNRLDCLELHCLSSLKSFCCGDYTLEFPSLKKVIVRQCLKMENFCHGVLSTTKLQKLQLTEGGNEVEECWEGNLNSTIQHRFRNKMNVRSSKED